jgi:hypothetical protein
MDFTYKIIGFHINDPTYYNWDGSISSYKFNNSFTFAINFINIYQNFKVFNYFEIVKLKLSFQC